MAILLIATAGAAAVYFATRSSPSKPSLIAATLAAVQRPTPDEFPTIDSAIRYLVEQVRAQNADAASRVLPIAYYNRSTFIAWALAQQYSETAVAQPFGKFYFGLGMLEQNYTVFAANLLDPKLTSNGLVVDGRQAAQDLEAQLDPDRLAHIYVESVTNIRMYTVPPKSAWRVIGVSKTAGARVMIGGIGTPRAYDFTLEQFGANWLIAGWNAGT